MQCLGRKVIANSLGRDIQHGETVVVKKEVLKPEYQKSSSRLFVCHSGYGMQTDTAGKTIYGYWKDNPTNDLSVDMMISGYEISKDETEKYQATNA